MSRGGTMRRSPHKKKSTNVGRRARIRRWVATLKKRRVREKLPEKGSGTDTWSSCHGRHLEKRKTTRRRRRKLRRIQMQRTRRRK